MDHQQQEQTTNDDNMYDDYEDLGDFLLVSTAENNSSSSSSSTSTTTRSGIRLLQITDLHCFPEDCVKWEGIPLKDGHWNKCMNLVDQLVRDTQPDLIILTGDVMDGRGPWSSADSVLDTFHALLPHFYNIPWVFIPGNHDDDESPWTRYDLLRITQLNGCIQRNAKGFHHTFTISKQYDLGDNETDDDNNNNHDDDDDDNDTANNKVMKVRLHLFDSGGNHPNPKLRYYCTPPQAVQGFVHFLNNHQEKIATTETHGLVYLHIPLPEFEGVDPVIGQNNLFQAALVGGKVPFPWNRIPSLVRFLKKDRIAGCSKCIHSGLLFQAIVQYGQGSILALFCGHDHHSDAVFCREGIFLGYGRSGSMTPPYTWEGKAPNPLIPGSRVVQITPDGAAHTWIQTHLGMEEKSFLDMTNYKHDSTTNTILRRHLKLAVVFAFIAFIFAFNS